MVDEQVAARRASRRGPPRPSPSRTSSGGADGWKGGGLRSGRSSSTRLHRSAWPSGPPSRWTCCARQLELARQKVDERGRHPAIHLQPHGRREAQPLQLGLERAEEVLGGVVVELEVAGARHPERVRGDDLHAREQERQVGGDDAPPAARRCVSSPAATNRSRSGGTFTRAKRIRRSAGSRSQTARLSDRFEMYGNGCPGSTASGVRTGKTRSTKVAVELRARVLRELVPAQDADAGARQARLEVAGEVPRVAHGQRVGPLGDEPQLRRGVQPVGREERRARPSSCRRRRGDADLVELVEVAGEDRGELHPLEQGQLGVLGQRQHPLVEVEPRQLAVQEPARIPAGIGASLIGRLRRGRHSTINGTTWMLRDGQADPSECSRKARTSLRSSMSLLHRLARRRGRHRCRCG